MPDAPITCKNTISDTSGSDSSQQQQCPPSALAATSLYASPSRATQRHLRAQKTRRVKFAQHVRETIVEGAGITTMSPNNSFADDTGSSVAGAGDGVAGSSVTAPSRQSVAERLSGFVKGVLATASNTPRGALFAIGVSVVLFFIAKIFFGGGKASSPTSAAGSRGATAAGRRAVTGAAAGTGRQILKF